MEAETKLAGLQQDIGQLSTMSDTDVAMEEAQAEQLQQVGRGGQSLSQGCLHGSGATHGSWCRDSDACLRSGQAEQVRQVALSSAPPSCWDFACLAAPNGQVTDRATQARLASKTLERVHLLRQLGRMPGREALALEWCM